MTSDEIIKQERGGFMKFNQELNYKEMCKEMSEEESNSGNVRRYQLERWQEKYNVEKVGRGKYIIYNALNQQEQQDKKDKKNYAAFLQATLLKYLSQSKNITTVYTYKKLREHLAMVNSNYFPVKYYNESIELDVPKDYPEDIADAMKRIWFDNADGHDEDAIKYALRKISDARLITMKESHVFYKEVKIDDGFISYPAHLATDEEESKFLQIGADYLEAAGCRNIRDLFAKGKEIRNGYYKALLDYLATIGYDRYAKAFVVTRAAELERVADYFAPEFNKAQVTRYLGSKRFKTIPPFIHEQMVDKLIKIKEED